MSQNPVDADLWKLHDHFDRKVTHELNLIGHRMAWLVTSESFLFAAWIASGGRAPVLPLVISIVGFLVAISGYFGIGAAMRVLDRMGGHYLEAVELILKLPPMGHEREDGWTIRMGNVPALVLPPTFAGVWCAAIYRAGKRMHWLKDLGPDDWIAAAIAGVVSISGVEGGVTHKMMGEGRAARAFPTFHPFHPCRCRALLSNSTPPRRGRCFAS